MTESGEGNRRNLPADADRQGDAESGDSHSAAEILDELQPEEREKLLRLTQITQLSSFRGPLPPPEVLEGYEKVVPGSAKVVFQQFEEQGNHRRAMEAQAVTQENRRRDRGQWMSFLVVFPLAIGGMVGLFLGYNTAGISTLLIASGTLLAPIVTGKLPKAKRRARDEGDHL